MEWRFLKLFRDRPVNLVGGRGGSGRITFEQFFFYCYNRSANFFLGLCRAIFFYINFFRKGRGDG